MPGRGQDERVWGDLLPRLGRRCEVVLADDAADIVADVVLAASDAASAAVHAGRTGRSRALVLLAPLPDEPLPEIQLDLTARVDEAFTLSTLMAAVMAIAEPEPRRAALADGMVELVGRDIPTAGRAALRAMYHDHADRLLDPDWARTSRPEPFTAALGTLTVPVLVVAAGEEPYAEAIGRAFAARAPKGELELLDTTQILFPWLARPDAAAQAVTRFLGRL